MGDYAVVGTDGVVINVIEADADFIKKLPKQIADDSIDTGYLDAAHKFYDVTNLDPKPGTGWTRVANGKFNPPPVVEPTPEEIAAKEQAEEAMVQWNDDEAFLSEMKTKFKNKQQLTQAERDRMLQIDLSRR